MNLDDRYQFQPYRVRVVRWCIYKPLWALFAVSRIFLWVMKGMPRLKYYDWEDDSVFTEETRWDTFIALWSVSMARADISMGHYYTTQEVFEYLSENNNEDASRTEESDTGVS